MNRVALVTGASSGIGRAVSIALARNNYLVYAAARRSGDLADTAAEAGSGQILPVPTDVTDPSAVDELFAEIRNRSGRLDLLFNNAGVSAPAVPIEDLTWEQWNAVVNVNLNGAFLCARGAMRLMKEQTPPGGRIINNGSLSAHTPRPYSAPYTATKHAITGLTKSLSLDGRRHNICCGQIDIGNAATAMSKKMTAGVLQSNFELATEPRMDVDHVANAVLYMAGLPLDTNVLSLTVMANQMPLVGRG